MNQIKVAACKVFHVPTRQCLNLFDRSIVAKVVHGPADLFVDQCISSAWEREHIRSFGLNPTLIENGHSAADLHPLAVAS